MAFNSEGSALARMYSLLGVDHVMFPIMPDGDWLNPFPGGELERVILNGRLWVIHKVDPWPRFMVYPSIQHVNTDWSGVLFDSTRAFARVSPGDCDAKIAGKGDVRVLKDKSDRLVLDVRGARGVVGIRQEYRKGWEAWLDGKPSRVFPVNLFHSGVCLDGPAHTLELRYRPRFWWVQLASLWLCGAFVVGYIACLWKTRRKNDVH
jgi:hypothetical protein